MHDNPRYDNLTLALADAMVAVGTGGVAEPEGGIPWCPWVGLPCECATGHNDTGCPHYDCPHRLDKRPGYEGEGGMNVRADAAAIITWLGQFGIKIVGPES